MTTQTVEAPRSAQKARRSTNWEKWGWIYMRASGLVLVVLVFGHLFINLIAGEGGVKAIDFGFVAGKWASPFWRVYDTLLLWLALIHGSPPSPRPRPTLEEGRSWPSRRRARR